MGLIVELKSRIAELEKSRMDTISVLKDLNDAAKRCTKEVDNRAMEMSLHDLFGPICRADKILRNAEKEKDNG